MEKLKDIVERRVIEIASERCFLMPQDIDEERALEDNIRKAYLDSIEKSKEIPHISDIYLPIWFMEYGALISIIKDVTEEIASNILERTDLYRFLDEDFKGFA